MANVIRYKRDQPTKRGLKKGNVVVGTGEENYGPTSATGYVAGITPPDGGYTIYTLSGNNDPAIYVANNASDLINIANTLGGTVSTETDALFYLNNAFNVWVVSSVPNNFITDGLKFAVDGNDKTSYPGSGDIWKDISGNKKPLSELRVLGAHHSGYQYPSFYNFFRTNCLITNEPVVSDLPANYPPSQVADQFDLVIVDEYVWSMSGEVIDWMKECVDLGVSCVGVGNDQRTGTFVASYNSSTRQSHDIRMDSKSRVGLQGRTFSYGSGDVYGGITALQNGAKPIYYRDDVNRITGYVYDNEDTGASFWFDQEGLTGVNNEIFSASLDYVTRNIGNRGFLYNSPTHNSKGWFDFDGVNDYIYFKNLPTFDMYCFEVVFRPHKTISPNTGPASADYSLVGFGRDIGNNNGVNLYEWTGGMTNETVTFWSHDGYATGITDTVDTNWHHMFFNWNGTTYDIWLDGEQKSTIQRSTGHARLQTNVSAISPGKNIGYNYYHSGSIAKIRAYDRTLSDSEISQNFYGGNIVTDGLTFATDAGNLVSYQNGSTSAYSLTGSIEGTLVNGTGFNNSKGGYWEFDNSNDKITFPNNAVFNHTSELTIESWVKFDGNSADFIFEKGNVNTQYSLFSHGSDIVFRTYHAGDGGYDTLSPSKTTAGIINGVWHHIVGSWDGSTKRIYVDGVDIGSKSKSGALTTTSQGAAIGAFGGTSSGYYFGGDIAIVRIYNKGLSQDEVLQNFNAQKARFKI